MYVFILNPRHYNADTTYMIDRLQNTLSKAKSLYENYEHFVNPGLFVFGFTFDSVFMDRIDNSFFVAQHFIYVFFVAVILFYYTLTKSTDYTVKPKLQNLWKYSDDALHFLLGSLLSVFFWLYVTSSVFSTSFLFLLFLFLILVANELNYFKKFGLIFKFILFQIALISFITCLIPVAVGSVGPWIYYFSIFVSALLSAGLLFLLHKKQLPLYVLKKQILPTMVIVHLFFIFIYVMKWAPAVPLSVKYAGVYHKIDKQDGDYYLKYHRSWWKFWQNGAQDFVAGPNDQLIVFTSIFAPRNFKDHVYLVFEAMPEGASDWQLQDKIKLELTGGRAMGFRGYAAKSNYFEGEWRTRVLTSDEREMGRIYFDITKQDEPLPDEDLKIDIY